MAELLNELMPEMQPDEALARTLAEDGPVVLAVRAALPGLLGVYAFGSRVQGGARPDSDLDLAVLVPGYAAPLLLWELAGSLADLVSCPVDLLDLRAASTVMQHQVLMQGRRLWGLDPAAGLFECFVLSEKTALDESRAGLLADILKEGKVHDR